MPDGPSVHPAAAMPAEPVGVLFVCLGNICRSPLAKCIFKDMIADRGVADAFSVDSCGTGGWHAGSGADPRSVQVAGAHGLSLVHTARKLRATGDFDRFDFLIAMDRANRDDMLALGAPPHKALLMRSFDSALSGHSESALDIPDPYYGGDGGFEKVYQMLLVSCAGLLDHCLRERRVKAPAATAGDPRSPA